MVFSSFVYFQIDRIMRTSSEMAIIGLSKQVKTLYGLPQLREFHMLRDTDSLKAGPRIKPENLLIILRDTSLNITTSNTNDPELIEHSSKEIDRLFESEKDDIFSQVSIDGEPYRIYTAYFFSRNGEWGILQICQSIEIEKIVLSKLLGILLLLGFTSIAILALISWMLAKKSLEPIKESWEQQKRFIADASHELRTPLTVMKANLEIPLQEKNGTISDNYVWIKNAYDETDNMSRIVNTLLELTQIDSGQKIIEKRRINISELAEKSTSSIIPLSNEKKIKIVQDFEEELFIMGDAQKLKQLMIILLDNALKYTKEGYIDISLKKNNSSILLQVSDTGIGISQEDKKHIFERFYRADKTRSRVQGSLGLGLSIAKWIVDEHNGKLEVESEVNKGSVFRVIFPIN